MHQGRQVHRVAKCMAPSLPHRVYIGQKEFAWQDGYSIFSISATARSNVKSYITNQREHHRVKTFIEELTEMLEKAGVEYDPKYLE